MITEVEESLPKDEEAEAARAEIMERGLRCAEWLLESGLGNEGYVQGKHLIAGLHALEAMLVKFTVTHVKRRAVLRADSGDFVRSGPVVPRRLSLSSRRINVSRCWRA
jgi:hypothetical protein